MILYLKMQGHNFGATQGLNFWKEETKPVPGRPSSKRDFKNTMFQNSFTPRSPYQQFQESVNDVWHVKYDEFEKVYVQKSSKQDFFLVHSACGKSKSSCSSKNANSSGNKVKVHKNDDCSKLKQVHDFNFRKTNDENFSHKKDKDGEKKNCSMATKENKLQEILECTLLNFNDLQYLSWSGIPEKMRPNVWKLLAGYLPASLERRQLILERKRTEFWNLVTDYFDSDRDEGRDETFRQIHIDIPRMSPLLAIFNQKTVQKAFERILFIWAVRHPASGYVQGMNDLVTPFFIVFLSEYVPLKQVLDSIEVDQLLKEHLASVEADTFWCFSKFLDGIQDNYIFAQLGIQHKVNQLKELIHRIDKQLHQHLEKHGVDYLQFSFRWMNNLLIREIPLKCCLRLWDTYLAEINNFSNFHLYVSAAFLLHWRHKLLLETDFQGLIGLLQNLPTKKWSDAEVSMIVAEAYKLQFSFADAPKHLQTN